MSGELDLTEIVNRGFTNVTSIVIGKGEITRLLNIPSSVKKLHCSHNLLIGLPVIPTHLTELHINDNHVSSLDLKGLTELSVLNCSNNELVSIENLPKSITELHCDNNNIIAIDLMDLSELGKLSIKENSDNLNILNVPSSITELLYDQNANVKVSHLSNSTDADNDRRTRLYGVGSDDADDNADVLSKRHYLTDLNEYFKLKNAYETSYRQKKEFRSALLKGNTTKHSKKTAGKVVPTCVNCSAVGGTSFRKKDGKYSAVCNGFKKKCNLNIKIFTGVHYNFDDLYYEYNKELENTKQEIIIQKMNTLFNYIKDEITADKFKKVIKEYSAKNEIFRDLTVKHKSLNDNDYKRELIDKKMEAIYSIIDRMDNIHKLYHDELNPQLLKDIVYIKVKELDPEILALRQLKYELCEMHINESNKEELFQRENSLDSITYSFDEPPHTIKYNKK
jgi:hypothetical protein